MVIEVRTIPQGRSSISRPAGLEAFAADLPPLSGKLSCDADIDRMGEVLHVHLKFRGKLALECSRCLETFAFPVTGDLRLVVREKAGKFGPSTDDETVDFFFDSRNTGVDLGSAIYEEIMTSLPIKPLCSQDCRGIEIVSNEVRVDNQVDPRWEALKKLRNK